MCTNYKVGTTAKEVWGSTIACFGDQIQKKDYFPTLKTAFRGRRRTLHTHN